MTPAIVAYKFARISFAWPRKIQILLAVVTGVIRTRGNEEFEVIFEPSLV